MKFSSKLIFAICFTLSLSFLGSAFSEDFSADMTETTKEGTVRGKIFATKDKVRLETPETVMIGRTDQRVIWMLMPNDKTYMEEPFDTSHILSLAGNLSDEVERNLVGSETINGKMTDKYHVVFGMSGKTIGVFQWVDKTTIQPVKTQSEDGSWTIEYDNLVLGQQPDSLFEVPKGYQKMSAPALPMSGS